MTDREHNAKLLYGVATGSVGVDAALDQLRLTAITTAPAAQPKLLPKPMPRGVSCRVGTLGAVSAWAGRRGTPIARLTGLLPGCGLPAHG
jgi:hypothetical protein